MRQILITFCIFIPIFLQTLFLHLLIFLVSLPFKTFWFVSHINVLLQMFLYHAWTNISHRMDKNLLRRTIRIIFPCICRWLGPSIPVLLLHGRISIYFHTCRHLLPTNSYTFLFYTMKPLLLRSFRIQNIVQSHSKAISKRDNKRIDFAFAQGIINYSLCFTKWPSNFEDSIVLQRELSRENWMDLKEFAIMGSSYKMEWRCYYLWKLLHSWYRFVKIDS